MRISVCRNGEEVAAEVLAKATSAEFLIDSGERENGGTYEMDAGESLIHKIATLTLDQASPPTSGSGDPNAVSDDENDADDGDSGSRGGPDSRASVMPCWPGGTGEISAMPYRTSEDSSDDEEGSCDDGRSTSETSDDEDDDGVVPGTKAPVRTDWRTSSNNVAHHPYFQERQTTIASSQQSWMVSPTWPTTKKPRYNVP